MSQILRVMSETLLETVQLDQAESNELLFKVQIEGHVSGPAKVRLVCESEDMSFMFPGRPAGEEGLVQFVLHKAAGLKEGIFPARIEVLIENRYFVPVEFNIEMKKAVQVFAEAVKLPQVIRRQEITVSASPVTVKKKPEPTPVVIEGPKKVQETAKVVPPVVTQRHPEAKPVTPRTLPHTLSERYQLPKTLADRYAQKRSK